MTPRLPTPDEVRTLSRAERETILQQLDGIEERSDDRSPARADRVLLRRLLLELRGEP